MLFLLKVNANRTGEFTIPYISLHGTEHSVNGYSLYKNFDFIHLVAPLSP